MALFIYLIYFFKVFLQTNLQNTVGQCTTKLFLFWESLKTKTTSCSGWNTEEKDFESFQQYCWKLGSSKVQKGVNVAK